VAKDVCVYFTIILEKNEEKVNLLVESVFTKGQIRHISI
jgi:hypothetical protein